MSKQILETFRASSCWDKTHDLPLCPGNKNPWIYGAYAMVVMKFAGLDSADQVILADRWDDYAEACLEPGRPGIYNRAPDRLYGWTSHDEIMGMMIVLNLKRRREIFQALEERDGVYINLPEDESYVDKVIRFNCYRFPWFRPFVKAACDHYVHPGNQAVFALHLANDMRLTKAGSVNDAGGRLRIWLMLDEMENFWISGLTSWAWKTRMNALSYSPKNQLAIEPREHPIISQFAPERF